MIDLSDTICALSSAPGRSGIAVIRVSGSRCREIMEGIFLPTRPRAGSTDRRAVLGRIVDRRDERTVDQALVLQFHAPHSYTGDDVAEISVHGSPVVIGHVLELLCLQGARLAEPGEFTMRAFLNGRMDLAQAEAVRDVIEANTRYQLQVATRQLGGALSHELEAVKRKLIDIVVELETAVEFADQDLAPQSRASCSRRLAEIGAQLGRWTGSFTAGRIVRDGFTIALIGRPNAGKSSLFNALLAEERSIVAEAPGTTRDLVAELVDIEGIPVRLMDTAGMRAGLDGVELLGVERSRRALVDADAVILVADTSRARCAADEELLEEVRGSECLVAFNKSDLEPAWSARDRGRYRELGPAVAVSARSGAGIEALRQAIRIRLCGDPGARDGVLVTSLRHCLCLQEAHGRLMAALKAMADGLSEEFVLADLHLALGKLGEITGATGADEILAGIFSRFCIGK